MRQLDDRRLWLGGGGVVALLIIAVAWFMFISPERSSVSDLNSQAAATRQQNSILQAKVEALRVKSGQITKYTKSLKAALSALPFDSGLPAFTRQLSAQGTANSVHVTSILVGGVTSVNSTASGTTPAADTSTGTATPAPSATPTATTATPAATPAGGLFSVAVTVQSEGTLDHQLAFLKDIQTAGPRRALISASQIAPGSGAKAASIDTSAAFTTSITVFSAPQTPDQVAQLNKLLAGKIGN